MPGTHYDNEHSFIEMLPFSSKRIAQRMIRDLSLENLILDLRSLNSIVFKDFDTDDLNSSKKEAIIQSCIIAKITSLDKTLFITESQTVFIEETLEKALWFFLKDSLGQNATTEQLHAYLKVSYPKTYYWLNKVDEDDRHSLAIRSRRENTRRFYRYDAKMRYYFLRVGSHEGIEELQGDIYSSGVKHFNKIVNGKLDALLVNFHENVRKALAEKFPEAHDLFIEVGDKIEYLREVLNGVSLGKIEIESAKRFLKENLDNKLDYDSLKGNVRTESILRDFEEKADQITSHTLELIEKSTPHALHEGPVLMPVKIDFDIRSYIEKKKRNSSSLLMSFIDLYHYAALLEKIYNNISASNYIIIYPEYWSTNFHDVSPGGFSFYSEFLVDIHDVLELFIQVDTSPVENRKEEEIIHQRCKVVRIEEKKELGCYQISCQFLTPTEYNIELLRKATQSKEVQDAYESAGLMDEDGEWMKTA